MPIKPSYVTSGDGDIALGNFVEISIDPALLNNFSNEEGLAAFFISQSDTEDFLRLKKQLFDEVMRIIDAELTERQKQVVLMTYIDGKTQVEISEHIKRDQSTVHKALTGNIDYTNKKRYGGALKKIRKLCKQSEVIQNILKQMNAKAMARRSDK